ncbi:phosphatase PAP2 family protein [Pseudohongiella spirulinae]|uniref:undecaprenyl-diphosphate phosphatase n=1 Tax=Pseudohongiella spirulinae TaxID=1249552 RepID=A0A0S2KCK8_9GAMM|nr:phosphatase PAP2 family protein [Pseudohongiella spirulinae]ALO45682.1 Phospholipid phosphatase [Pseudohongiella spirulinae]
MTDRTAGKLQRLADMDARLFLALNSVHRHVRLERLVRAISFTGDGYLYLLLAFILPMMYPVQGLNFLVAGLVAFLIELPVYWALKNAFKRRRPFRVVQAMAPALNPSDEFSFPSGHTTAAFMMAALLSTFFPALSLIGYCWACLIGLSRIMLRVHFLSDVLAGALLGTLIAYLSVSGLLSLSILG